MAETIHDLLRVVHISTGFVGLAAFWIPALARQGGGACTCAAAGCCSACALRVVA